MENKRRIVDIYEYMPVLIDILHTGKDVQLLITGNSMAPFLIHQRDTIIISPAKKPFYVGEMVFFIRDNGQYVMHRIHHIDKQGNLFIVGDNQTQIEGPIRENQVFGTIHKVIRKGVVLQKGDFWYDFFEKYYIHLIPFRRLIVKSYGVIKRIFH